MPRGIAFFVDKDFTIFVLYLKTQQLWRIKI